MARRRAVAAEQRVAEEPAEGLYEMPEPVLTSMVGGAGGAPVGHQDAPGEVMPVYQAANPWDAAMNVPRAPHGPAPRQFKVMNPYPVRVVHGGGISQMAPGKIVSEGAYSIENLRAQGVRLEEIVAP